MNYLGVVAGAAAFLGIWGGHVAVRRVEASAPALWLPATGFVGLGGALELAALLAPGTTISAACGILGTTLLWDALELVRQENRVRRGHAPANPANPRHRRLLEQPGTQAVAVDVLKQEPR